MNRPSPGFASSNWPVSAAAQPPQDAVAHDHDFLDFELCDRKLQRRRDAVAARSSSRTAAARLATLRTTNISPGSASKMIAGSTRLSEQAMTMHLGALALREFRPARSLLRPIG